MNRWRYRRRRAGAVLVIGAVGVGIYFLLTGGSGSGSPPLPTTGGAVEAKRTARITQLQQRVAAAKEASVPPTTESKASDVGGVARASFAELAAGLPGDVGIAYTSAGRGEPVRTLGPIQTGSAWSTIKVAIAARVIKDAGGAGRLSSGQRSLISSALRASDNAAAMSLWEQLISQYGSGAGAAHAVGEILAGAGDTSTTVSSVGRDGFSPYGQTEWSLAAQARFMAALAAGCVPGSAYLLGEMDQVVSDQRWGLGQAGSDPFKGGWGPGDDGRYLVRQMGTLNSAAVAIAALPSDGQFATGQQMLTRVAQWAADNVSVAAAGGC